MDQENGEVIKIGDELTVEVVEASLRKRTLGFLYSLEDTLSLDSKNKTEKLIANNKKAFYDWFYRKRNTVRDIVKE